MFYSFRFLNDNDRNGWELEYYPAMSTLSLIGAGDQVAQGFKTLDTAWHHIAVTVDGASK